MHENVAMILEVLGGLKDYLGVPWIRVSRELESYKNIGMNCGEDAGQTVFHCHVHLIPRRKVDMDEPKGGVRGVIPNKRTY